MDFVTEGKNIAVIFLVDRIGKNRMKSEHAAKGLKTQVLESAG
jgi:hypothetical protein